MDGRLEEAEALQREAIAALIDLKDAQGTAQSQASLSELLLDAGRPEEALALAEEALALAEEVGARVVRSHALARIALSLDQLGRAAEARQRAQEAIALIPPERTDLIATLKGVLDPSPSAEG